MGETATAGRNKLRISVHGPGATIESAVEVAEASKKLLDSVADNMGVKGVAWQIASVQFQCDGCGLLRAERPGPDEGWTYRDGNDFCPACGEAASDEESPLHNAVASPDADVDAATADESSTDNERGSASTQVEALSVQPTEKRP